MEPQRAGAAKTPIFTIPFLTVGVQPEMLTPDLDSKEELVCGAGD
jgi:hypothetical protein